MSVSNRESIWVPTSFTYSFYSSHSATVLLEFRYFIGSLSFIYPLMRVLSGRHSIGICMPFWFVLAWKKTLTLRYFTNDPKKVHLKQIVVHNISHRLTYVMNNLWTMTFFRTLFVVIYLCSAVVMTTMKVMMGSLGGSNPHCHEMFISYLHIHSISENVFMFDQLCFLI